MDGPLWAAEIVGATYWRSGFDMLSHVLAAFALAVLAVAAMVLVVRDRREVAETGSSDEALRAHLRKQLDMRIAGFRTMKGLRTTTKVLGLTILFLGLVNVVKEQFLGNGWAGVPMLVTAVLWALLLTVWPTVEERRVLPRLERAREGLGA